MAPQFNLLRDRFARFHRIAETSFKIDNGKQWVSLRVATWKDYKSYYHISKVKDYIPDVYN